MSNGPRTDFLSPHTWLLNNKKKIYNDGRDQTNNLVLYNQFLMSFKNCRS